MSNSSDSEASGVSPKMCIEYRYGKDLEFHLNHIQTVETASYPADEAAQPDQIQYRLEHAPDCFMGAFRIGDEDPVGYVCGTKSMGRELDHDSMSYHCDDGELLCIHSVVVEEKARGSGVGHQMMIQFLNRVQDQSKVNRVVLVAKEHLIGFYENVGFKLVGRSSLVHGKDPWFELEYYPTRDE